MTAMKRRASSSDTPAQTTSYKEIIAAPGRYLGIAAAWLPDSFWAGAAITTGGLAAALAMCLIIDHWLVPLLNPGWFFLPIVALVGYRWGWRLGLIATAGEIALVWFFFTSPRFWQGLPDGEGIARLAVQAGGTLFTLALVDLAARQQRDAASLAEANAILFRQEAERRAHLEALHHIGAALTSEL
ncbi:MAG TPA: DUF4118 domain-containing protein, partial [Ktedonobacterales bacterium]|nr:DUF4118 domain-containing protein [Ktedonobacterales bacterium]